MLVRLKKNIYPVHALICERSREFPLEKGPVDTSDMGKLLTQLVSQGAMRASHKVQMLQKSALRSTGVPVIHFEAKEDM